MKQLHLFIVGSVQGVGFRQYIKRKARQMGLTGWIRNRADGSVEAVAQGVGEDLQALIRFAKRGVPLSEVQSVTVEWEEQKEQFNSFDVLATA